MNGEGTSWPLWIACGQFFIFTGSFRTHDVALYQPTTIGEQVERPRARNAVTNSPGLGVDCVWLPKVGPEVGLRLGISWPEAMEASTTAGTAASNRLKRLASARASSAFPTSKISPQNLLTGRHQSANPCTSHHRTAVWGPVAARRNPKRRKGLGPGAIEAYLPKLVPNKKKALIKLPKFNQRRKLRGIGFKIDNKS